MPTFDEIAEKMHRASRAGISMDEAMRAMKFAAGATPDLVNAYARAVSGRRAEIDEAAARAKVLDVLPRGFKWTIDHPRLVALYFWIRPSKRPTMYVYR
jgi:hypothetical protein